MEIFIIYAALSIGNLTTFVEFKPSKFPTLEECTSFYEEHKGSIKSSLINHLNVTTPNAKIQFIGCSPKSTFLNLEKGETT
mgnify:FL=1